MSVNKVLLLGNVCHTPQVKADGKICTFSLATTKRGFTTQNGHEVKDRTEFHNLVVTGGLVKVCEQYVSKGDKLYVEGEIRYREYEGKDGTKKNATEIFVDTLEMLTLKQKPQAVEDDGLPFPR